MSSGKPHNVFFLCERVKIPSSDFPLVLYVCDLLMLLAVCWCDGNGCVWEMALFDLTAMLLCSSIENLPEMWCFLIHIITLLFKAAIDLLHFCPWSFCCVVSWWHFSLRSAMLSCTRKQVLHLKGSSYGLSFTMETILWHLLMHFPG